jgi:hypothetical protein
LEERRKQEFLHQQAIAEERKRQLDLEAEELRRRKHQEELEKD